MDSLAAFILALYFAVGPNGHVLQAALEPAETRRNLPVEAFSHLLGELWVVFHDSKEWAMATYAPAGTPAFVLGARRRPERLLPGLEVPRLYLYSPYYRPEGRTPPATDMTIDVAQYFAETLVEAALDLQPPGGLDERAAHYGESPEGGGIPTAQRRSAYASALAQFGAESFSLAVEIRRSLARQRAAGKDPCKILHLPGTLFGQWGRVFDSIEYRGLYRPPGAPSGRWTLGPPITANDKRFLIRQVFEDRWSGDVRRDFSLTCPL